MDLKNLLRTYVYLSDPRVKQVTIKFTALLIALGAVAAVTYAAVTRSAGDESLTAMGLQQECMPEEEHAAWQSEHADDEVVSSERAENGEVCVTYRASGPS